MSTCSVTFCSRPNNKRRRICFPKFKMRAMAGQAGWPPSKLAK